MNFSSFFSFQFYFFILNQFIRFLNFGYLCMIELIEVNCDRDKSTKFAGSIFYYYLRTYFEDFFNYFPHLHHILCCCLAFALGLLHVRFILIINWLYYILSFILSNYLTFLIAFKKYYLNSTYFFIGWRNRVREILSAWNATTTISQAEIDNSSNIEIFEDSQWTIHANTSTWGSCSSAYKCQKN